MVDQQALTKTVHVFGSIDPQGLGNSGPGLFDL